jgi:hypothetical protein
VAVAVLWAAQRAVDALGQSRAPAPQDRQLQLLALFAPAVSTSSRDPRMLLSWHALAGIARRMFPDEFGALDRASGAAFPFSRQQIQDSHAHWTAEWLAWEGVHDAEYRLKRAVIEQEVAASGGSPTSRARLDAVEREKLESYQRRYEEYIRVAKALQSLVG